MAVAFLVGGGSAEATFPGRSGKIAFSTARFTGPPVWIVRADGSGRTHVGSAARDDGSFTPAVSPDGTRIALPSANGSLTIVDTKTRARKVFYGPSSGPAWSPDGRLLAVTSNEGTWLLRASDGRTSRVDRAGVRPAWSPSGDRLAYYRLRDDALVVADLPTGVLRPLAQLPAVDPVGDAQAPPAWSRDGRRIAFERGGNIVVVPASGGAPQTVTRGASFESEPAWSPDGRWIAFLDGVGVRGPFAGEVAIVRPDGSGRRRVTRNREPEGNLRWLPDSRRVAFVLGEHELTTVDVRTGRVNRLTREFCGHERLLGAAVARRAPVIAFTSAVRNDRQIWATSADGRSSAPLVSSCADEESPAWAADGGRLAFVRGGVVWVARPDGANARRVGAGYEPAWSPDGRRLAFVGTGARRRPQVFVMSSAGGDRRQLTTGSGESYEPDWSPDGARIAFVRELDNRPDVWTIRPDGTGLARVTQLGGTAPSWSPGGDRLAYVYRERVYTIRPDGTDPVPVIRGNPDDVFGAPSWSPDGSAIVATQCMDDAVGGLVIVEATGGKPSPLEVAGREACGEYPPAAPRDPAWQPLP